MEIDWMRRARCRTDSPDRYFPSSGLGVQVAKSTCGQCSVRIECLEYALVNRIEHGVWGGCSERERRRIRSRRRAFAVVAR